MAEKAEALLHILPKQKDTVASRVERFAHWFEQNCPPIRLGVSLAAIGVYAWWAVGDERLRNPWAIAAGVAFLGLLWVTITQDRLGAVLFPLLVIVGVGWVFWAASEWTGLALLIAVIFASTGIFPLTYLAYLGFRAPAQRKRLRNDFRLLGLASEAELKDTETEQKNEETERMDVVDDLFQTVYSPSQFFVFIVLNMLLVICADIAFLTFIGSKLVPEPVKASIQSIRNLGIGQLATIFAAFFGAYLFAIQELVRRYNTFDLLPQVYSSIFVRMMVATGIVAIGALFIGEQSQGMSTALVVAFLIGTFPQRGIDWLTEKVHDLFENAQQRESSVRPLTDLIGISPWHEARLQEMGIDDAQNLATVDIRKLLLTTQFDTQEIVHWIDQAILYVKLGPQLENLRANHIATLYELRSVMNVLLRTPPVAKDPNNGAVNELVRDLKLADVSELRRIVDPTNYPNFAHIAEYYARSKMVAQQRAAEGTEVIVGSQLPYLAMDIQGSGEESVDLPALKETIEQIEKLLDNKPSDAKLWLALGVHCQHVGKHLTPAEQAERDNALTRAKRAYDEAIRLEPQYAEAYLRRAAYCLDQAANDRTNYANAIRDSSRALHINPGLAVAYNYRGLAQNALGYGDLALEDFGEALRLNDGFAEVYMNRGTVYNALERFADAVQDFHCANLAGLRTPSLLASWGKALLGQAKFDEAVAKLSEAIACDPTVAISYADRGVAYWQTKAYQEAQNDLRAAIQLDPKLTSASVNLGRLWIEQKQFPTAVETLENALAQTPDSPDESVLHFHLARAYFFNAQYPEAIMHFNKALEIGGDNLDSATARLHLSLAYKGNKQDDSFGEELQKIVSTAPQYSEAYKEAKRLQSTGQPTGVTSL